MKKLFYLLVPFLITSCSSEENFEPTISTQSYTAEIGDLITLSGTNLGNIRSARIFSQDYNVPAVSIYDEYRINLHDNYFVKQTDTEIQFILPELHAETYTIQLGEQEIPLNVKGFIPLYKVLEIPWERITGLKVINDDNALVRSDGNLYSLNNGYYEARRISGDVRFFNVLENGDTWYATSIDYETYNIYYSSAGSSSYTLLRTFQLRDLESELYHTPFDIVITPEKQIFIATTKGIFILKENEIIKDTSAFSGLSNYPLKEREVQNLRVTSAGTIFGKLYFDDGVTGPLFSFLYLDPRDYTFSFSEKYTSNLLGPEFQGNFGYMFLPNENRIFKTTNSGLTWGENLHSTPGFEGWLEIAQLNVLGANTVIIFLHSAVGAELRTTTAHISRDGGNTWQESKHFNGPRQKELFPHFSDFTEQSGLLYFTDFTRGQLWKYVD